MELEERDFSYDDDDRISVVGQSWEEPVTTFAGNLNLIEMPTLSNNDQPPGSSLNSITKNKTPLTCGVCGVEFSSYQALGGHKASHNKRKIVIHDEGGKRTFNVSVERSCKGTKITARTTDAGAAAAADEGNKGDGATAVDVAVASSGRGLNLDLNLPPPPEE